MHTSSKSLHVTSGSVSEDKSGEHHSADAWSKGGIERHAGALVSQRVGRGRSGVCRPHMAATADCKIVGCDTVGVRKGCGKSGGQGREASRSIGCKQGWCKQLAKGICLQGRHSCWFGSGRVEKSSRQEATTAAMIALFIAMRCCAYAAMGQVGVQASDLNGGRALV